VNIYGGILMAIKKKNGVYFNEKELREILGVYNDEIKKIYMPNDIFNDLINCNEFKSKISCVRNQENKVNRYEKNANANHIAFAFSYLYLASYMYKYARFTYYKNYSEEIFIDDKIMYMILNSSPTSRGKDGISYITKKGGVLEKLGYIRKEGDYPLRVGYEIDPYTKEIDISSLDFVMFSDIKNELPSGDSKGARARKVNYPIRAFYLDEESERINYNDGYFYLVNNSTMIDINVFIYCMARRDLGTVGFYLYCFLKSKCDYFGSITKSAQYTKSMVDLELETGIGKTKLDNTLKSLERHNMITNSHRPFVPDLPNDKKIPANSYSVNDYKDFRIRDVKTRRVMSYQRYDKEIGVYINNCDDISDIDEGFSL
jgi:hypothetical protein